MLKYCIVLISVFWISTSLVVFGQTIEDTECATQVSQSHIDWLVEEESRLRRAYSARTSNENVPRPVIAITAHIVRNTNGTGGITEAAIINELAITNQYYKNAGLEFYIREFNYINNSDFFNFLSSRENAMAGPNDRANTINIYFVNSISIGFGGTACGYAYLPGDGPDRILMRNDCAINGSTLPHEIGHFFNLIHTHGPSDRSNELVNGSNCATAADLVCDTPADPLLSITNVNENCQYTGNSRDANNQLYLPNVRNIMSYSRITCRDQFSPMQYSRMKSAYELFRSYLALKPTRAGFFADERVICQGSQIKFNNVSTGAASRVWSFPGGSPSTSTQLEPTITYNTPGTYSVTLIVNSGAGMTDTHTLNGYITVKPSPSGALYAFEGFEGSSSLSGMVFNEDGNQTFEISTTASSQGTKSAMLNMFNSNHVNTIDRLYSKPFQFSGVGTYLLQFDYAYKNRDARNDKLDIYRSNYCYDRQRSLIWTKSGLDLSRGKTFAEEYVPSNEDWIREGLFFEIDEEDSHVIEFEVTSQGGNNLYLDNYKIRKVKPIDYDSIQLINFYNSLNGELPWDLSKNLSEWEGVEINDGRVIGLNFAGFGLNLNLTYSLAGLDQLASIDFSANNVLLNANFLNNPHLKSLRLNNAGIQTLPSGWNLATSLEKIHLDFNEISSLNETMKQLVNLKELSLKGNKLTSFNSAPFISNTIAKVDFSYNQLTNVPTFNILNEQSIVNMSNNYLTFDMMALIPIEQRQRFVLANQRFFGDRQYFKSIENEEIRLNSGIVDTHENTTLRWYRNGEEILEYTGQSTISFLPIENWVGNYQARATNPIFPDVVLYSSFKQVDTFTTLCDKQIAGTYKVSTSVRLNNASQLNFVVNTDVSAVGNGVFNFNDISGGLEMQQYNLPAKSGNLQYSCGQFSNFVEDDVSYFILNTSFDEFSGDFSISWENQRGDVGISVYELITPGLSSSTEFLAYQIPIQVGPSLINPFDKTVRLALGCIEGSPPAVFELSDGAKAYVNDVEQISSETIPASVGPFEYKVVAEDGFHFSLWTVYFDESPRIIAATFLTEGQDNCFVPNGYAQIDKITVNGNITDLSLDFYTIEWSSESEFVSNLGNELNLSNQPFGTYFFRVTEKESGCRTPTYTVNIADETNPAEVNISLISNDRACSEAGQSNGELLAIVNGIPTNEYTIKWVSDLSGDQIGDEFRIVGLEQGDYNLEIFNNVTGCTYTRKATVELEPSTLSAQVESTSQTDCVLPNGSISILKIIQNGIIQDVDNADIVIEWSDRSNFSNVIGSGYLLNNLFSGTYYLRVRNTILDCSSEVYNIFVPANMLDAPINLTSNESNTSCSFFEGNGSLSVNVGGATLGYNFQWYNGTTTSGTPIGSSNILSELLGGAYTVKVTSTAGEQAGCFSTFTTNVQNTPNQIDFSVTSSNVTVCTAPNGRASISEIMVNGQRAFIFNDFEIEWSNFSHFLSIVSRGANFNNLAPGQYFVRIREKSSQCVSAVKIVTITEDLINIQPEVSVKSNVNCTGLPNGELTLSGLQSDQSFGISWFRLQGEQEILISNDIVARSLQEGTYKLQVLHLLSGCSFSNQYTVGKETLTPTFTTESSPQTSCAQPNGSASVVSIQEGSNTSANFSSYNIQWSANQNFSSTLANGVILNNQLAGTYFARITNRNTGCVSTIRRADILEDMIYPSQISLKEMLREKPNIGVLGSLTIEVEFESEYTVKWFEGEDATGVTINTGETISNITAGNYTALVTGSLESGGCNSKATFTLLADRRLPQIITFDLPKYRHIDDAPMLLIAESNANINSDFEVVAGEASLIGNSLTTPIPNLVKIKAVNQGNELYFPAEAFDSVIVENDFLLSIKTDLPESFKPSNLVITLFDQDGNQVYTSNSTNDPATIGAKRGEYFLKVAPSEIPTSKILPYYFENEITWQNAEILSLEGDSTISAIFTIRKDNNAGFSTILRGGVFNGGDNSRIIINALRHEGQPKAGLTVLLFDAENNAVGAAITDEEGKFEIRGVPPGIYSIWLDAFGIAFDARQFTFELKNDRTVLITAIVGNNDETIDFEIINNVEEVNYQGFSLYPNPVQDQLSIVFGAFTTKVKELTIFNTTGQKIFNTIYDNTTSETQINMLSWPNGMYIVTLTSEKSVLIYKVLKE